MNKKILIGIIIAVLVVGGLSYFFGGTSKIFTGRINKFPSTTDKPQNDINKNNVNLGFGNPALTITNLIDALNLTVKFKHSGKENFSNESLFKIKIYVNDILYVYYYENGTLHEDYDIPNNITSIYTELTKSSLPKCKNIKIKVVLDPDNQYYETNENDNTAEIELNGLFVDDELIPPGVSYFCDPNQQLSKGNQAATGDLAFETPAIKLTEANGILSFQILYKNTNTGNIIFKEKSWLEKKLREIISHNGSVSSSNIEILKKEMPKCTPLTLDVQLDPDKIYKETDETNNNTQFIFTILNDRKVAEGKANC